MSHPGASRWSTSAAKRLFDIACAAPVLCLLSPVLLVIAVAVRLTSDGPALFRQRRAGMGRHEFTLYKFRSMRINASGPGVTKAGDPRLTRLGAFLRKYKLDELPQLYNVVRGDMSLVGPRPKLPKFEQMQMDCRPGVTGAATLAFAKEEEMLKDIPLDQMDRFHVEVLSPAKRSLDESYQSKATFVSDFGLLVRTVFRISGGQAIAPVPDVQPELPKSTRLKRASGVRFQTQGDEAPSCDSVAS